MLTDAACEYNFYASDITRTIPINGIYSKSQKEIYNIVLHAQKSIEMCKPGTTLIKIHQEAVKWISKGLIKLDLVKGVYKKF